MSIQPIDLQVLFSRLEQLGKEQAIQKEVPVHNQLVQGAELARQAEAQDHAVNQAREVAGNGIAKVKDEKKKRRKPSDSRERELRKPDDAAPAREEVVRDPDLGRNVDLMG